MLVGQPQQLGFSITSPFKKVGSAIKTGVKYTVVKPTQLTYKAAKTGVKYGAKGAKAVVKYTVILPTKWTANALKELALLPLRPVRTRVRRLVDRRAGKIAWDKRKSKTPTPAERAEAKSWTKSYLNKQLPHGPVLAQLAGLSNTVMPDPNAVVLLGDSGEVVGAGISHSGLGIAPAVVAAAVPVLIALINMLLNRASASGEAPAQPGEGPLPADDGSGGGVPGAPGEVDLGPVQEAAADAAAEGAEAVQAAVDQASGRQRVGGMRLPKGVSKNHLLIGGAVFGGLLLIMLLKPKN